MDLTRGCEIQSASTKSRISPVRGWPAGVGGVGQRDVTWAQPKTSCRLFPTGSLEGSGPVSFWRRHRAQPHDPRSPSIYKTTLWPSLRQAARLGGCLPLVIYDLSLAPV